MSRASNVLRALPALLVLVTVVPAQAGAPAQAGFSFDALRARARELSANDHVEASAGDLPEWLAELDFDGYQRIRFRAQTALWTEEALPFRLGFAHRGYLFRRAVPLHWIDGAEVRELRFGPRQFHYYFDEPGPVPPDLGYAGFTVLHELETPGRWDEVASFLGASYFRVLGRGQGYGASARGLAIDTAAPGGEEFPEFVEAWIETPAPESDRLVVYTLLESPSATGAYRFALVPGDPTVVEVTAHLYPRQPVEKLGLAPLTSMFLFGEARLRHFSDYRPEVHDSDGLLVAAATGEWIWRPLQNPKDVHRVTRLPLEDPRGFGLLQRDRSFASYADLEARYERRPSYWVTPDGAWGAGAVELIEIPSDSEGNDNVAAYWVPAQAPAPGEELAVRYTLAARLDDPPRPPLARVRDTRIRPGEAADLFVLDFDVPEGGEDPGEVRAEVVGAGVRNVVLRENEPEGGVRCTFEVSGKTDDGELRARLLREDRLVSETWVLPWRRP